MPTTFEPEWMASPEVGMDRGVPKPGTMGTSEVCKSPACDWNSVLAPPGVGV